MCVNKEGVLVDRREMLRVKSKSLADEARIIRKEERRSRSPIREELHWHRVSTVRDEARATHLAYGLIKGKTISQIERPTIRRPRIESLWKKVQTMITKYGPVDPVRKAELLSVCKD